LGVGVGPFFPGARVTQVRRHARGSRLVAAGASPPRVARGWRSTILLPGEALVELVGRGGRETNIMGVFIVHGVYPGPQLFIEKPDLAYGIFGSLFLINIVIMVLLICTTRFIVRFVRVEERVLGVVILAPCFVGAYSVATSFYGVMLALLFGVFGWLCAWMRLPVIPMALGLVMGDFLESSLRQTLNISDGSWWIFLQRPIAACIVALGVLLMIWPLIRGLFPATKALRVPTSTE
jgi:putative tricarboxylic transport membrane protein